LASGLSYSHESWHGFACQTFVKDSNGSNGSTEGVGLREIDAANETLIQNLKINRCAFFRALADLVRRQISLNNFGARGCVFSPVSFEKTLASFLLEKTVPRGARFPIQFGWRFLSKVARVPIAFQCDVWSESGRL
jgi:hypothetical protein